MGPGAGGFFDLPPGRVLGGRYRIERRLAAGGMAAVFEATIVGLGRRVAVKTLHPRLGEDRRSIERLRREALAVAGLQHPNIVQILDFRDDPGEPVFLVMELLEGRTLFDIVHVEGPQPWSRVAGLARQLLAGLTVTHGAGLLHRDLKPANVFVVPLGGGGDLVKLLDFGLAAVREGPGFEKLTRTGVVVGTPAYMAPEQARGDRVDVRADVYGAGAVLFHALTGRRPFEARTAGEILVQVVVESPPPLRQLRPDLSPGVDAVVARALAKRPQDRYPDAAALAAALAAVEMSGAAVPPRASQQVVPAGSRSADAPTAFAPSLHVSAPPAVVAAAPAPDARRWSGSPQGVVPLASAPPSGEGPRRARPRWLLAAGGAGAVLTGVAAALIVWAMSRDPGGASVGAAPPDAEPAAAVDAERPVPEPAAVGDCRRPAANVPASEFSTDVRVVLCDRCLSPLQTASSGGEATCGHCGAVQVVPPRDDRTLLAPADRAAIPEAERVRLLRAQEGEPWRTPESLQALVPGATIPAARMPEAMSLWNQARRELRETGSREAGERLVFLTLMLGTHHGRAGEPRLKRAVFESALDVVRLPQDLQAIRGGLSRAAALDGDTCSAEAWLAPCDPRPRDLESDSQWRVARAFIDTVHGDWNAVLGVLGRDADEVPIREKLHTLGAMLRANAWERLGRLDTAVELLRRETGYRPDARQAMLAAQSYYASLRLCAGSLAELGLAPSVVASPDAGDAVEADVVSEIADGPSAGEGGEEAAASDARAPRPVPSGDRTTGREDAAALGPSSSGVRDAAPTGDPAVPVDDGSARSGSGVRVESVEGPEDRAPYEDLIPMLQLPLLTLRTRVQAAANRCPSDGTWHGVMTMTLSGGSGTPIRGWDDLQYRPSARAGTPEADQLQALATCIVRHLEGVALPFWRYGYQVRVRLSVF